MAQEGPSENDFYKILTVPIPEGIVLEGGGIVTLPSGDVAVATRRGEVWLIENPYSAKPFFKKYASGLHEILGLAYKNGSLYAAQRGELTKLIDKNNDGHAETYECVYAWPISGHYHEYSFGPKIGPDGSFYVTANVGFGSPDWWAGKSLAPWRGWTMRITEDGKMEPYAAGMRSPCGIGLVNGEFFYGDNQGDWMGSGFVTHVEKGDFFGHPQSLKWADRPESPVKARMEQIFAKIDPRDIPTIKPENDPNQKNWVTYASLQKDVPGLKVPAVWLPHGILGISTSEILGDETKGGFGPFEGQMFVGDQGMSKIARVFLEKVNGQYQGAAFDFRSGFQSGVLRMSWGNDNSMFVGQTNRGWSSAGKEAFGLQRLVWTGKMPFEIKAVRAMPDGFELEFTKPADTKTANDLENYFVTSFIYKYHPVYGSPVTDDKQLDVRAIKLSTDGLKARIVVDGLRKFYIHDLKVAGIKSTEGDDLLHPEAFYTLNNIPEGEKLNVALVVPKASKKEKIIDRSAGLVSPDAQTKEAAPKDRSVLASADTKADKGAKKPAVASVLSETDVMKLLQKNTCLACHKKNERAVGPAYTEIAKRKYSVEKIMALIANPEPDNWPDYTPMAPMSHIPKTDTRKIAEWIVSLKK